MNKAELIKKVAKSANLTIKEAEAAINAFIDAITATLKAKDKISLIGFGTFETVKRAARIGRNPKTGKEIKIPATVVAKFRAGKTLKETVAGKTAKARK